MKTILLAHAARYPLMEPRDAVKLIYQNEFGGGHLIRDELACLEFLRREYESVPQNPTLSLLEDIGNQIVRVNLAALDAHGFSVHRLGELFLRSAAVQGGTLDSFLEKLNILTELTKNRQMPFSAEELSVYLAGYAESGYPALSHSDAYRNAYRPAYRVIHRAFLPEGFDCDK